MSSTDTEEPSPQSNETGWQIAVIVLGVVLVLTIIIAISFYWRGRPSPNIPRNRELWISDKRQEFVLDLDVKDLLAAK